MTELVREYMWTPWDIPGNEHLRLHIAENGSIQVDSQVVMVSENRVLRLSYRIELDVGWRVRSVRIASEQPDGSALGLALQADGIGNWTDGSGISLHELDGCIDIDIQATPFTNTIPIRRLHLVQGQPEPIKVAYISVPVLEVTLMDQRYTKVGEGQIRYESVRSGFVSELDVDADGIAINYPGYFRRDWPRAS